MLTVTFLTNTSSYYKNYRKTSPTSVSHYKSGDGLPKHVCQRALSTTTSDCPGAIAKGFTAGRDEQGYRDMDLLRQASL